MCFLFVWNWMRFVLAFTLKLSKIASAFSITTTVQKCFVITVINFFSSVYQKGILRWSMKGCCRVKSLWLDSIALFVSADWTYWTGPSCSKGGYRYPLDESLFLWIEQLASLILILWIEDIDIDSVDGAIQRLSDRSFDRCGLNTLAFVWMWGWGWPCFGTNLLWFLIDIMLEKY